MQFPSSHRYSNLFLPSSSQNLSAEAQHVSPIATKYITTVRTASTTHRSSALSKYTDFYKAITLSLLNSAFSASSGSTCTTPQCTNPKPNSHLYQHIPRSPERSSGSPLHHLRRSWSYGHCRIRILVQRHQSKLLPSEIRTRATQGARTHGKFPRSCCGGEGGLDGKLREVLWRICVGCWRKIGCARWRSACGEHASCIAPCSFGRARLSKGNVTPHQLAAPTI
jgi:hypothetical protein